MSGSVMALSEDYFRMQQNYIDKYIVSSRNRKYLNKRIDLLIEEGWKLKSMDLDKDGFFRAIMVK